jgi:LysR family transcriptional activator of mexEF-oprN operon
MPVIDSAAGAALAKSMKNCCHRFSKAEFSGAEYQPFPVRFMPAIVLIWPLSSSLMTLPGLQMNRNDLRRVDLNLLIVFETLMHERSVTRAAEKLFLGQPAISAALSRLRSLFDDPLFVRTGRSMEPSARAVEIFALLSPALDSISTAVSRASEFDPATSTSVFRIGLSDDVEFALLPMLLKRLRAESPGIVLVVRRVNYILMPGLLASGEISIGVSYTTDLPANAKRKVLRRSQPKLLRADTVPGPLSLDDYCARPHALVSFAGDLSGFIDEELEKLGRKRHVVLAVPQFNGLSTLLAGTDIVATVPDYTAEALTAAGGVRAEDPPLPTRTFELHMAWRGSQDNDPGERWLRSRIQMFFGDPDSL